MAEKVVTTGIRFLKNLVLHGRFILARKETLAEAFAEIGADLRKVRSVVAASSGKASAHKRSAKLTEAGRRSYNRGSYAKAERLFRDAAIEDPQYALPVAYLGDALYKQGRLQEAVAAWERAYALSPSSEGGQKASKGLEAIRKQVAKLSDELEAGIR
jgi:tetratricopeptide (TPR) repeat protein